MAELGKCINEAPNENYLMIRVGNAINHSLSTLIINSNDHPLLF
jgi:hypothetical protein